MITCKFVIRKKPVKNQDLNKKSRLHRSDINAYHRMIELITKQVRVLSIISGLGVKRKRKLN